MRLVIFGLTVSSSWGNGVYRSTDGGDTWIKAVLDASKTIPRILADPKDAKVAWAAVMGDLWNPSAGRGLYNIGIAHLASKDYPAAVAAFDAASRANPLLAIARERASQVRFQLLAARTGYAGTIQP